jgi:hypothetical protein
MIFISIEMVFISIVFIFISTRMVFILLVMILNFTTDGFHLSRDDFKINHVFGHIRLFFAKKHLTCEAFVSAQKRRRGRQENLWCVCHAATADGRRLGYVCFEKKRKYIRYAHARACIRLNA